MALTDIQGKFVGLSAQLDESAGESSSGPVDVVQVLREMAELFSKINNEPLAEEELVETLEQAKTNFRNKWDEQQEQVKRAIENDISELGRISNRRELQRTKELYLAQLNGFKAANQDDGYDSLLEELNRIQIPQPSTSNVRKTIYYTEVSAGFTVSKGGAAPGIEHNREKPRRGEIALSIDQGGGLSKDTLYEGDELVATRQFDKKFGREEVYAANDPDNKYTAKIVQKPSYTVIDKTASQPDFKYENAKESDLAVIAFQQARMMLENLHKNNVDKDRPITIRGGESANPTQLKRLEHALTILMEENPEMERKIIASPKAEKVKLSKKQFERDLVKGLPGNDGAKARKGLLNRRTEQFKQLMKLSREEAEKTDESSEQQQPPPLPSLGRGGGCDDG